MSPAELAALLHFYADAGIEWMLEDDPIDRVEQFRLEREARQSLQPNQARAARVEAAAADPGRAAGAPALQGSSRPAGGLTRKADAAPAPRTPAVTMPDEHAVTEAKFAAESARSLSELKTALEGFAGCNLKASAKSTIFASGEPSSGVMIVGGMPSGDDDREGLPFSGRPGLLLDRMLSAIGLDRGSVMLTTVVPWRPPGDRPPTQVEAAICRPFIERQIELAEPRLLLLLGNFTVRFFFNGHETIHALRGQWREIGCGSHVTSGLACLHPQELLAAPAGKALAWRDLLDFRRRMSDLN